ncbi:MAG: hypothetical protein ACRDHK_07530, partial [Actinomycetota bacterium]
MTTRALQLAVIASATVLVILGTHAGAYEVATHEELSRQGFRKSGVAGRLGAFGLTSVQKLRGRLLSLRQQPRTPEVWVTIGGGDEDLPPNRVLNHFYDPHYDVSLTFSLGGAKAPDWALEDAGDLAGQNHSYKDARQAFYDGLTLASRTSRERELGHTFYALGHVIHLIQDLTVAEHTRDDLHLFIGWDASLFE